MKRGRFFVAEQALAYGLIDRVITAHDLTRAGAGYTAALAYLVLTPGDDRLRRGRIVGVVASRGSQAAS